MNLKVISFNCCHVPFYTVFCSLSDIEMARKKKTLVLANNQHCEYAVFAELPAAF